MILDQNNQDVQDISIFFAFCKFVSLKNILMHCCKFKARGVHIFDIFQALFFVVFRLRNLWRLSASGNSSIPFARDTAYRFLNSPYHHWRAFLAAIAKKAISFCWLLTEGDKRKVFVVDDSVYNKNRSKKLELLSRVFDHAHEQYVKGFRFLTLAFTDGVSLIPIDFALLGTKKILCDANPDVDKRSSGFKRRLEAVIDAPSVLLSMIDNAWDIIHKGSYIVFDSWFCTPSLIREIVRRGLHVTGRLKNDKTHFLFRRNSKDSFVNLEQLYKKLKRIPASVRGRLQQTPDILDSFRVCLPSIEGYEALVVRIVFVKNKSASDANEWLALLTTDLKLTEEEVVRMYAKRWKIEEFFKVAKSLLKLEREYQGRSSDMLIAHATLVCTRYIFLEVERRRNVDIRTCGELFWYCCEEIADFKLKEALILIFKSLQVYLGRFSALSQDCLKEFIASLPAPLLRLIPIPNCLS
jgi:hypothetical protein